MFTETKAWRKSYDLGDWEGGIAVYVSYCEHGVKIVSIPRLGLSTAMLSDIDLTYMLNKNRTLYNNPKELELFSSMIIRDIRTIGWEEKRRGKNA